MKKVVTNKLDFASGGFTEVKEKIKVRNFNDGDALSIFRQFLIDRGYKDNIGKISVNRKKYGDLQYLTLFGHTIKVRFALWQAQTDTEGGKAVLWLGEKNTANFTQEQVDYGVIVDDRIIRTDAQYYALIVTTRDFRVGTDLKAQPFVDYLLIPIEDMIEILKQTHQAWVDIRKSHREKYAFNVMISKLKQFNSEELS